MCEERKEDEKEVKIMELRLENDGKERKMEGSSGKSDGLFDKIRLKDQIGLEEIHFGLKNALDIRKNKKGVCGRSGRVWRTSGHRSLEDGESR